MLLSKGIGGFPGGLARKYLPARQEMQETRVRSLEGGNGNPLQCSGLENPTDRGAWWAAVPRVTKSRTFLGTRAPLPLSRSQKGQALKKAVGWGCGEMVQRGSEQRGVIHAAAKSLLSHLMLCDAVGSSPPGSSVRRILQQEHWRSRLPLPSPWYLWHPHNH